MYIANPAVQPIHKNITALAGNNVSIEFYVSSEPFITSTDITWSFNGTLITAASSDKYNFTFDNRILNIQSVDISNDGEYNITVKDSVSATTRLIILCKYIYTLYHLLLFIIFHFHDLPVPSKNKKNVTIKFMPPCQSP